MAGKDAKEQLEWIVNRIHQLHQQEDAIVALQTQLQKELIWANHQYAQSLCPWGLGNCLEYGNGEKIGYVIYIKPHTWNKSIPNNWVAYIYIPDGSTKSLQLYAYDVGTDKWHLKLSDLTTNRPFQHLLEEAAKEDPDIADRMRTLRKEGLIITGTGVTYINSPKLT